GRMRRDAGTGIEGDAVEMIAATRGAIRPAFLEAGDMRIAKIPAARTLREITAEGGEMTDLRRRKTERRGGDAGIGGDDALIGADGGHRGGGADAKCAVRAPFDGYKLGRDGDIDQRPL